MSRQKSLLIAERNAGLLQYVQALKAEHPFWSYRRIGASLRFVEQRSVNKKRMLRLMRAHPRLVTPKMWLQAKRPPTRSNPKPTRPNEWWGIAMTTGLVQGFGWIDIFVAVNGQFPEGPAARACHE